MLAGAGTRAPSQDFSWLSLPPIPRLCQPSSPFLFFYHKEKQKKKKEQAEQEQFSNDKAVAMPGFKKLNNNSHQTRPVI